MRVCLYCCSALDCVVYRHQPPQPRSLLVDARLMEPVHFRRSASTKHVGGGRVSTAPNTAETMNDLRVTCQTDGRVLKHRARRWVDRPLADKTRTGKLLCIYRRLTFITTLFLRTSRFANWLIDWLTELRFYVPLDINSVISKKFFSVSFFACYWRNETPHNSQTTQKQSGLSYDIYLYTVYIHTNDG